MPTLNNSPSMDDELREYINRKFIEAAKLSTVHNAGKGAGLLSDKLEALAEELLTFTVSHTVALLRAENRKAYAQGYTRGIQDTHKAISERGGRL